MLIQETHESEEQNRRYDRFISPAKYNELVHAAQEGYPWIVERKVVSDIKTDRQDDRSRTQE